MATSVPTILADAPALMERGAASLSAPASGAESSAIAVTLPLAGYFLPNCIVPEKERSQTPLGCFVQAASLVSLRTGGAWVVIVVMPNGASRANKMSSGIQP